MHPALLTKCQSDIASHGQHLIGVFPTKDDPCTPFVYTIGNALHGLPELLVVGNFDPNVAGSILNTLGQIMRESGAPLPEEVDIGGKFPVRTRRANAQAEYTVQAGQFLGREDYDVQQVLLCDPQGVYPGESGIAPAYDVPLV